MYRVVTLLAIAAQVSGQGTGAVRPASWKQYAIAESGFSVALPFQPQSSVVDVPSLDEQLRVYQTIDSPESAPSTYSVFVGKPTKQGVFEPASMDAYLDSHIKSMVGASDNGKLQLSRRVTFRGQPALEYQFSHRLVGRPYIARGVTFMIDGGHIRVSMSHSASDSKAEVNFKHFIESFRLIPVAYRAADEPFSDSRGILFSPPDGWKQQPTRNAVQAARFTNLTRSITLIVAGAPAYRCSNLQGEVKASGRLTASSPAQLNGQQFTKLTAFEDVPKYQVRLTTVHYCIDSRLGAVVLSGTEEESMFPRWAQVFEGAAASIRVR